MHGDAMHTWMITTHLGSASIMLPMAAMIFIGYALAGHSANLARWALAMLAAVTLVLLSKIAFIGWGIGSATLDFTGISGHAMLSASILPVWLAWLLGTSERKLHQVGIILGLLLAALIAWSRVRLGAHSPSEVVAGWLLGASTSLSAYRMLRGPIPSRKLAYLASAFLLFILSPTLSGYLPTRTIEIRVALALSGHAHPYTRFDLHRYANLVRT